MYLHENIKLLKAEFPAIDWDKLMQYENYEEYGSIKVEASKNGMPTLTVERDGIKQYIHSKYDPYDEAERIFGRLRPIEKGKHVLFFGIGLGYLIEVFVKKYPNMTFSIYEPNPKIFYYFLSYVSLKKIPLDFIKNIFIEGFLDDDNIMRHYFLKDISLNATLVALPSYENLFSKEFAEFSKEFIHSIKSRGFDIRTRYAFEKLWMSNCIRNFGEILRTNNMIHKNRRLFRGKPAIVVSAGPSLEEEIENLRYIKENGLAYIFAVGSANKALLSYSVYPDAACAVDGTEGNCGIYEKYINNPDNSVPLIYGGTLYYKVVIDYNYKKLHININTDALSEYYLKYENEEGIEAVGVAPSVAIITLQMLGKLGCDPIILVGQNFAFKNAKYYSNGISDYKNRTVAMTNKDMDEALLVEDVEGNMVYTIPSLNIMRTQTEVILELQNMRNVINSTKGGAKIEGTTYETLDSMIENRLDKRVVSDEWLSQDIEGYDRLYLHKQYELMVDEHKKINEIVEKLDYIASNLLKVDYMKKEKTINNLLNDFAGLFSKLINNKFYGIFLFKISSAEHDIFLRDLEIIAADDNLVTKAQRAGERYTAFINSCKQNLKFINPLFEELNNTILKYLEET